MRREPPAADEERIWDWRLAIHRSVLAILAGLLLACTACQSASTIPKTDSTKTSGPTSTITLALLGDIMLGRAIHATSETFDYLKPSLLSADLALANLESPLTNASVQTDSPYALCAPPENVKVLAEAGFDLLSLSNNHRLDCGIEGLTETQLALTESGLGFIGPDPKPVDRLIDGTQLALLAFDATNEFRRETAIRAVHSARESGAIVVVSMHWGAEYQAGISRTQEQLAEDLAGAGASLIWGHHPHVLQPARWINGHKTLVLYSLGNALFDQYGLANTRQSALALVRLGPSGVQDFDIIPFLIDIQNSRITEARPADSQIIMKYFP